LQNRGFGHRVDERREPSVFPGSQVRSPTSTRRAVSGGETRYKQAFDFRQPKQRFPTFGMRAVVTRERYQHVLNEGFGISKQKSIDVWSRWLGVPSRISAQEDERIVRSPVRGPHGNSGKGQ